jgi:hypothetical protein
VGDAYVRACISFAALICISVSAQEEPSNRPSLLSPLELLVQ